MSSAVDSEVGPDDSGAQRVQPRRPVVLSVEQALSMSYATLRFVHLGWRVIRLEATPVRGRKSRGDPNRFIGRAVAGEDRHSYFVGPNVGKEAIAVDLKSPRGRALLHRLVGELPVDVFCTNTLPARHAELGFDYATLSALRPELIWCGISAMGLDHPEVPGYDPMMQALCGYMDITGLPDGAPLQCGPPLTDLKAGDEAFTQVILAMLERTQTGRGKCIDVSMARAAVSWLQTFLPMLDMGSPAAELRRSGNEHRQFIPVNAYPTADGYIYVAIGSDAQWARFVATSMFASLARDALASNEGRRLHKDALHRDIGAITRGQTTEAVIAQLSEAAIPHARITAIENVMALPFVADTLLRTQSPDGTTVRLPPAAVETAHLAETGGAIPFAPAYGEHTDALLAEVNLDETERRALFDEGIVA